MGNEIVGLYCLVRDAGQTWRGPKKEELKRALKSHFMVSGWVHPGSGRVFTHTTSGKCGNRELSMILHHSLFDLVQFPNLIYTKNTF